MTEQASDQAVAAEASRLDRSAVAPRAMLFASTSFNPMLRGPQVAYAPEDDGGQAAEGEGATAETVTDTQDIDPDRMAAPEEPDIDPETGEPRTSEAASADDDHEEVEHEGQKYKLPKALKPLLLMQADYTKKTQELAETRRTADAEIASKREAAAAEAETLLSEVQAEVGKVHVLKTNLEAFEKVDWDQAWREANAAENPAQEGMAVTRAWNEYQRLQGEAKAAEAALEAKKTELQKSAEQGRATRMQEVGATLAREIPGFNQEVAGKIMETGKELGLDVADFATMDDPRAWKGLHALYSARQEIADLKTKLGQKFKADEHVEAQLTTPAKALGGKSATPAGVHDSLSTDEWMRRERARVAAKQKGR
ncbi:hypothetical protein [Phenylobacterium sp.]|uniref:hypothetical protein n=1 Tax=Phenylobacterium sp. TaxID=1871053 RepID=UPI002737D9C3|nr:hypothetical protein [Phenylobacterium sp.]MDP3869176.1 hypothetical protein [Phenylobacterium sp.]